MPDGPAPSHLDCKAPGRLTLEPASPVFEIRSVQTEADLQDIRDLFAAYAASLPVDLSYQNFDAEVAALPGAYCAPSGDLWLAQDNTGRSVGCVGLRELTTGVCEMKRLYIEPSARGLGLGLRLSQTVINRALDIGYREVRLDTLPSMAAAVSMYRRVGFVEIDAYYCPHPTGTIFLALDL